MGEELIREVEAEISQTSRQTVREIAVVKEAIIMEALLFFPVFRLGMILEPSRSSPLLHCFE